MFLATSCGTDCTSVQILECVDVTLTRVGSLAGKRGWEKGKITTSFVTVGRLHSEEDRRGKRKQSKIVDTRVFPISEREFSPMGFASLFSL